MPGHGLVKICGLREVAHAKVAAETGADLIGFIFAPSRRQVTSELAADAIAAAKASCAAPLMAVGVFVDASPETINNVIEQAGLDLVQLHGTEPPGFAARIAAPVIRVHRLPAGTALAAALRQVEAHDAPPARPAIHFIEGHDPAAHGGTGVQADWGLAAALARRHRLVLAGGLSPDNVASAISVVQPQAVDVSSGVETAGVKDPAKIRAFVAAARAAFAAVSDPDQRARAG